MKHTFNRGFTIVELIIVVAVVAILSTLVAFAYNGITKSATEVSMKSDLDSAASALAYDYRKAGAYPATAAASNGGRGLVVSAQNQLTYQSKTYGYCVSVASPKTSSVYRIKSTSTSKIEDGGCDVTVTTLKQGGAGFTNGTGTVAALNSTMYGVAVDSSQVLYIAESGAHRIQAVSTSGVISVYTGSGTYGYVEGAGSVAQFKYPYDIAVNSAGVMYVADNSNGAVRKVLTDGTVSTLAGNGSSGFAEGTGTTARFNAPTGIDVDSTGTIYVADANNHRIRKVTPLGVVSTLAGAAASGYVDNTGAAARFNSPRSVAVAPNGDVYVADMLNNRIRKITPLGVVTTVAGSGVAGFADGMGLAAQFNNPYGIAVDSSGIVYVADTLNRRVRQITTDGVVTTLAGSGTAGSVDGLGGAAQFTRPEDVAVDADGSVYIVDASRIRKLSQ